MIFFLNGSIAFLSSAFIIILLITSILEKEKRASFISLVILLFNTGLWIGLFFFQHVKWIYFLNLITLVLFFLFILISLLQFFPKSPQNKTPFIEPFDERDHMFSRNNLQQYPELAEKYYTLHPDKKEIDKKIHNKPELGEPGHLFYDEDYTGICNAAFSYLKHFRKLSWGETPKKKKTINKENTRKIIRELALSYGAIDIGFAPLKPHHYYSHTGRHAENWGEKIEQNHYSAIVIIVPMDIKMIKRAPSLPIMLESSRQYVEAAKIAHLITEYIHCLGYTARSHTDGNYQVICVPLAIDAGLGTLGRMGLLIHPVYGPCIRIAAVTTELNLSLPKTYTKKQKNRNILNTSIQHFCKICKKCAENCPTQSIYHKKEPSSRSFQHWSINQETCYSYWKTIGTDCGFCLRVCPYSKPNTLIHQLVRFYISRNSFNQYLALWMDHLFYKRKIKIPKMPPAARGRFL